MRTELEQKMVAVERIHAYCELQSEVAMLAADEDDSSSQAVQSAAQPSNRDLLVLQDVTMRYRPELPPTLKGIDLEVKRGEKLGLVGRSGCGKSSLLAVMFRLVPRSGAFLFKGAPVSGTDLYAFRSRVAFVPQSPVLFKGTVRYNLDPVGTSDEALLLRALGETGLDLGLDLELVERAENISMGQRQLLCFARALLRVLASGVDLLLLDEAFSTVDF